LGDDGVGAADQSDDVGVRRFGGVPAGLIDFGEIVRRTIGKPLVEPSAAPPAGKQPVWTP
jgi:hypothetical protein